MGGLDPPRSAIPSSRMKRAANRLAAAAPPSGLCLGLLHYRSKTDETARTRARSLAYSRSRSRSRRNSRTRSRAG
jgi:hypothetical protein